MGRNEQNGSFIVSLQILRAVAAIAVMLFHVSVALPHNAVLDVVKLFCMYGFVGVDVFFVLSGFVVMQTASRIRSTSDSRAFLLRRLGRVYIGYWPVLVFAAALPFFGVPVLNPGGQWLPSALLVEPAMERNVLPVAYTLVYELWFYVLTALAMTVVTSEAGRERLLWAAVLALLSWQAVLMATDFVAWSQGRVPLSFVLSGIHLEFLAGALTFVYRERFAARGMRMTGAAMLAFGLVALVLYWQLFGLTLVRALIGGTIGVGALLLALSASRPTATDRNKGFLERVGDASFSLYLLHTLVLAVVSAIASQVAVRGSAAVEAVVAVAAIALSIVVARIWYVWLERPLYVKWSARYAR